jgi:hypothetical protein
VTGPIRSLEARDPAFDRLLFEARTITVMRRVIEAWCAGDLGPTRALVSDDLLVRCQTELARLASIGLRNAMSDWEPLGAELVRIESNERWDTLHVRVTAQARDRDVDRSLSAEARMRQVLRAPLEAYEEVWSFVRRRGATSPADFASGAIGGTCARCGAPHARAQTMRCETCGAVSNSGDHDWVLAEIAQTRCARSSRIARPSALSALA